MATGNFLGMELGSTRIKAMLLDGGYAPICSGASDWKSDFSQGIWTYSLDDAWRGLKEALRPLKGYAVARAGISGMMHGYLAFDKEWRLLVPFRTWQNTITAQAAEELSALFQFNIPQRWSVAHLYQAILNGEEHLSQVAHITTLAGYIHYMLTGVNAIGVGEASGMFPIASEDKEYRRDFLEKFDQAAASHGFSKKLIDLLPRVLVAGEEAGKLTEQGAALIDHLLPAGTPFAPCEGDAGTGMTATNAVAPRTGNVSAGTSIFSMVVLDRSLSKTYPEIDMVTTPAGDPVAMVHCNNCTGDMNAWVSLLQETLSLFGKEVPTGELFTTLYQKSLEGEADCGGVSVCNYLAGEGITHLDEGRPMVVRSAKSNFTLANFLRSQLYATMATLSMGMELLARENVTIDALMGHGGLFKTPGVGQKYLAAACNAPVTCMESAGEGGPYGMALLAAFVEAKKENTSLSLQAFLRERVFAAAKSSTLLPEPADVEGFRAYAAQFQKLLKAEKCAVDEMNNG